jgi:hypothetical protein
VDLKKGSFLPVPCMIEYVKREKGEEFKSREKRGN